MKNLIILVCMLASASLAYSQVGHIMQGVGAVNMSMGGASTAQPLDINGALYWNPASISAFDSRILKFDIGAFFSAPSLTSSLPAEFMGPGAPAVSGTTEDDRGISPMPALAFLLGSENSRHTFAISAFGVSGFGVTFPEEENHPLSPGFNPMENSNPINYPQAAMGFGRIESDYGLFQIGLTYAYELTDNLSIGIQPILDYSTLELLPNPTSNPSPTAGYPSTDKATAIGFGGQVGIFYRTTFGLNVGVSYKTTQWFEDFELENTFLDNSTSTNSFNMDFPAILSIGLGYSSGVIDLAADYRFVDYENTDGFERRGWTETGSVAGFGWDNISVVSTGIQFRGIEGLPLRLGYTFSSVPVSKEVVFFNVPATAIIKHAFQAGLSFAPSERMQFDLVYHHGMSSGATTGQMLSPLAVTSENPMGSLPGTEVSYEMTTDLIQVGFQYKFQ